MIVSMEARTPPPGQPVSSPATRKRRRAASARRSIATARDGGSGSDSDVLAALGAAREASIASSGASDDGSDASGGDEGASRAGTDGLDRGVTASTQSTVVLSAPARVRAAGKAPRGRGRGGRRQRGSGVARKSKRSRSGVASKLYEGVHRVAGARPDQVQREMLVELQERSIARHDWTRVAAATRSLAASAHALPEVFGRGVIEALLRRQLAARTPDEAAQRRVALARAMRTLAAADPDRKKQYSLELARMLLASGALRDAMDHATQLLASPDFAEDGELAGYGGIAAYLLWVQASGPAASAPVAGGSSVPGGGGGGAGAGAGAATPGAAVPGLPAGATATSGAASLLSSGIRLLERALQFGARSPAVVAHLAAAKRAASRDAKEGAAAAAAVLESRSAEDPSDPVLAHLALGALQDVQAAAAAQLRDAQQAEAAEAREAERLKAERSAARDFRTRRRSASDARSSAASSSDDGDRRGATRVSSAAAARRAAATDLRKSQSAVLRAARRLHAADAGDLTAVVTMRALQLEGAAPRREVAAAAAAAIEHRHSASASLVDAATDASDTMIEEVVWLWDVLARLTSSGAARRARSGSTRSEGASSGDGRSGTNGAGGARTATSGPAWLQDRLWWAGVYFDKNHCVGANMAAVKKQLSRAGTFRARQLRHLLVSKAVVGRRILPHLDVLGADADEVESFCDAVDALLVSREVRGCF